MMLLDINPAYFKIEFLNKRETALEDANKLVLPERNLPNPAFIIANSGVSLDGEPFVKASYKVWKTALRAGRQTGSNPYLEEGRR